MMKFNISRSLEILENTPFVLNALLQNLSAEWYLLNEGGDSWSPYDIIGHFIHGEKTDWMVRLGLILDESSNHKFEEFDRFAQFENSQDKSLTELLHEFEKLRNKNVLDLRSLSLADNQMDLEGIHPEFGIVSLKQLIATWVVHDLGHIAQITRVMAFQYKEEVGPWKAYLGILKDS